MKISKIIKYLYCPLILCTTCLAQNSLETEYRLNGKKTLEVFQDHRDLFLSNSVIIYSEGDLKRAVYGMIMSSDGYILTKASELNLSNDILSQSDIPVSLQIRLGDNKLFKDVKLVGYLEENDLALLKIDVEGLTPVVFAETSEIAQGSIVLSNGASTRRSRRARVGVISANAREIKGPVKVEMGIKLKWENEQFIITDVEKNSAAAEANLKIQDIILEIDDKKIGEKLPIRDVLKEKSPGDLINLLILRENKKLTLKLELMAKTMPKNRVVTSRNDSMSGQFSRVRSGFSRVLQIDIPIADNSCGGPLLNLSGECLGLIIARANRAETFVLPLEEVKAAYQKLLTDLNQ